MKQLFLTSSNDQVTHDLVKRLKHPAKGQKLAFIDTASETSKSDKQWLKDDRAALVKQGFEVSDYTLTGKNIDQLRHDLNPMDVIYVSGGNTFYLLQQAQKSGFTTVVHELVEEQGKPYISTSAGSVIAGPDIYPVYILDKASEAPELKGYQGFGLVNFVIFPHWGSDKFKEWYLNHRLEHAYQDDQQPIVMLTDNQYVWVEDDKIQIIDAKKY